MKKLLLIASLVIAIALSFQFGLSNAWAARKKVDCAKVMEDLSNGKKVAVVAKDLKISRSSVYRCRRRAKAHAKETGKGKVEAKPAATPGASK